MSGCRNEAGRLFQINLTYGRIAAADGRFSRQCAFSWEHNGATWWIQLNLCFLGPTRVHNPNGKSIGSFFAQLTAESPYTLQWAPLCPKIVPTHEYLDHHLTHDVNRSRCHLGFRLGWVQPKWHLDRFSRFCRAH